jgi:hypothetical protein
MVGEDQGKDSDYKREESRGRIRSKQDQNSAGETVNPTASQPASGSREKQGEVRKT